MPLFAASPDRDIKRLLDGFRKNFLFLISDGAYPPHRQQRLYQWCQKVGLSWTLAREHVAADAAAFLQRTVQRVTADGNITPAELAGLQTLQRRLGLPDESEPMQRLYDLVERKIETLLLERAAYLSAENIMTHLQAQISAYRLPVEREARLQRTLAQQHQFARLMAGDLPVIRAQIDLYPDEACHYYQAVTFVGLDEPARYSGRGILAVTSRRVMILAQQGGMSIDWNHLHHIRLQGDEGVQIWSDAHKVMVFCPEPQYVSTLLIGGQRRYNQRAPQPQHPGKRLA